METRSFCGGRTRSARTASARMLIESRALQQRQLDLDLEGTAGGYQPGDILEEGSQVNLTDNFPTNACMHACEPRMTSWRMI